MSYEAGGMPAGGNSRFRGYPARMSERQQLALILQMTSQEMTSGSSSRSESTIPLSHARSSPVHHQKSSKNRWANKNADLIDTSFNRQDDRLRIVNGCDTKERNEFAGSISPDEVRQASGAESPVAAGSPAECAATAIPAAAAPPGLDQQQQQQDSSKLAAASQDAEQQEDAAAYEMRRTPPTNKVDRQASGAGQHQQASSGSSPRVTLRLNQVRATRDEKKGAAGPGTSAAAAAAATAASSSSSAGQGNASGTASSARQQAGSSAAALSSSQMESSTGKASSGGAGASSTSASASSTTVSSVGPVSGSNVNTSGAAGNANSSSSSSSADGGDVYEFKSSKEATPVRGSSTSPNPSSEKDGKEVASSSSSLSSSTTGNQSQNVGSATSGTGASATVTGSTGVVGSSTTSSSAAASSTSGSGAVGSSSASSTTGGGGGSSAEALAASVAAAMSDEPMMSTTSPQPSTGQVASSTSTKRAFESDSGQADEQDEEGRKRKKKDTESGKEVGGPKGAANRQAAGRNNPGVAEKCAKSGKQAAGAMSTKGGQSSSSVNAERKSPSASLNANSPKPSNSSSSSTANNPKGSTPASAESDGEDERSKNSDCNSAPKVPPLKIVIPQSTTSEQEQGNRNGKNTSNRSHQLPYVVASSNSNDSMDKEQSMSAVTSGTTSPLDNNGAAPKSDEKKDFSGALDNESRSTHHQRVLRSSHRSGNGGNGTNGTRETSSNIPGNGNYSNSSPLPANTADRSNNSSPQQRHHSPTPESSGVSEAGKSMSTDSPSQNSPAVKSGGALDKCEKNVEIKKEVGDTSDSGIKKESGSELPNTSSQAPVELHPRKRKMKPNKEAQQAAATAAASETTETTSSGPEIHPHDQPITNCYQLFLNIRKQIERRRKGLFPVQPKPPQGFKDYLMNRCTYVLAGNANKEPNINPPVNLMSPMKDLYIDQEKERYRLRMQHVVEKEKLVLSVEQEILRVHGRAARALANQSLPFSVCTILKDEEVYNVITPEQEEKDRNARSRYNGRLFLSWLQDVDDKWEKIKEAMLLRHHNEAESLHAVQRMDWEWKLKEVGLCEFKATPQIEDLHVPMVHVSDDFDLLPA